MINILKVLLIIVVVMLPVGVSAWTEHLTFETGVGPTDGFDDVGLSVDQSSTFVHEGTYSARVYFEAGDACWESALTCGATYTDMPSTVGNGDEIWTRAYYYFPMGFDWGDLSGALYRKILRNSIASDNFIGVGSAWDNSGDSTGLTSEIIANTELPGAYTYAEQFTGTTFTSGQWVSVEQYLLMGVTPTTSRQMVWLDGVLIFDSSTFSTTMVTLRSTDDSTNGIFFFTQWNGEVRTSQYAYIDDVIITTDTPSEADAGGNPMIGPSDWSTTPVDGACGDETAQVDTRSYECATGTSTNHVDGTTTTTWDCEGVGGSLVDDSCSAAYSATTPTCSDGIQNGDETGVDCGGSCDACVPEPTGTTTVYSLLDGSVIPYKLTTE